MSFSVPRYLYVLKRQLLYRKCVYGLFARRFLQDRSSETNFKTFEDLISFRRLQAKRSALIGVKNETSIEEILGICDRHGTVTKRVVFHPASSSEHHFVFLVEYSREEELRSLLSSCRYPQGKGTVPVFSRILGHTTKGSGRPLVELQAQGSLVYHNPKQYTSKKPEAGDQLDVLYAEQRLSDLGTRLRFLFCMQIEDSLSGLFPDSQVLPFGSSVNGFGCNNCDLDAFLNIASSQNEVAEHLAFQPSSRCIENARMRTQVMLEVLGDFAQNFFPCIGGVQRILRARVPILKMYHTMTGIDCDISVSNGTGYHMSELLFLLGELDSRVRPLVFAVRHWAHCSQLTRVTSGPWITNFSLTLMVLYFLQTRTPPVLPTVQQLRDLAGPEDECIFDGVDCTFKRAFSEIPKSNNTDDIRSLFRDFFHFCNETDWTEQAISLVTGDFIQEYDGRAIFIQNPLEHGLNVAKNVTPKEFERFLSCVRNTVRTAELNWGENKPFSFIDATAAKKQAVKGLIIGSLFDKPAKLAPVECRREVKDLNYYNLNRRNRASDVHVTRKLSVSNLFDKPKNVAPRNEVPKLDKIQAPSKSSVSRDSKATVGNSRHSSGQRKVSKQPDDKQVTSINLWKLL